MDPSTGIAILLSVFAIFVTILIQVINSIDKRIENKLKDPLFIKMVASEVRLPFLIFDEDQRYIVDSGASEFIQNIRVVKGERSVLEIVVTPKILLPVAPIMESFDSEISFDDPIHGEGFDWIFKTIFSQYQLAKTYPSGKRPSRRFKLQLVGLPK